MDFAVLSLNSKVDIEWCPLSRSPAAELMYTHVANRGSPELSAE